MAVAVRDSLAPTCARSPSIAANTTESSAVIPSSIEEPEEENQVEAACLA